MKQEALGSYLRAGRESAGLTVEAVAEETRIPLASVRALEEERFEDLPRLVFVRGFIQAYCQVVGVEPEPALYALTSQERTQAPSYDGPLAGGQRSVRLAMPSVTEPRGLRFSHILLIVAALAIFIAAYIVAGNQKPPTHPSANAGEAPPSIERVVPQPRADTL